MLQVAIGDEMVYFCIPMGFQSFEEMTVWQEARLLMNEIGATTKLPPAVRDLAWTDQIMRSALSIMSNIAEGNDSRTNNEFIVFLGYAKRSSTELRSQLYYALDQHYITDEKFQKLSSSAQKIAKQLYTLMKHLREHAGEMR